MPSHAETAASRMQADADKCLRVLTRHFDKCQRSMHALEQASVAEPAAQIEALLEQQEKLQREIKLDKTHIAALEKAARDGVNALNRYLRMGCKEELQRDFEELRAENARLRSDRNRAIKSYQRERALRLDASSPSMASAAGSSTPPGEWPANRIVHENWGPEYTPISAWVQTTPTKRARR